MRNPVITTLASTYASSASPTDVKLALNNTVGSIVIDRGTANGTKGLSLQNNTVSTAGATQQPSPVMEFIGGNWNGASNEIVKWRYFLAAIGAGISGAGATHFKFQYDDGDGSGYHNQFAMVGGAVDGAGNGNLWMRTGVTAASGIPALRFSDGVVLNQSDVLFQVDHGYDAGPASVAMSLRAGGDVYFNRYYGTSAAAPLASALGTNVTSITATGNDAWGTLSIVTGGATTADQSLGTITFNVAYLSAPVYVGFTAANQLAATTANAQWYPGTILSASFQLKNHASLAAGTYVVGYKIGG